jgi:hypothetical protein
VVSACLVPVSAGLGSPTNHQKRACLELKPSCAIYKMLNVTTRICHNTVQDESAIEIIPHRFAHCKKEAPLSPFPFCVALLPPVHLHRAMGRQECER